MGEKAPRPAYVVDVDDSGKRVPGSRRSAKTGTKERPKVTRGESGRSDKSKRRDADEHAAERAVIGSGARKQEVITTEKEERRKSTSSSTHSPRKEQRPPSAHKNHGFPKLRIPFTHKRDEPSHFGVATPTSATRPTVPTIVSQPNMTQPIPMRPRPVTSQTYPTRPLSYHAAYTSAGGYGPPLSASAWTNYQPAPQPVITPSYPPPSPGYMHYAATPAPPPSDYFGSQAMSAPERPMSARPLASRFNPPSRTSSGFGFHDAHPQDIADAYSAGYHDDGYTSASEGVARRRESIRIPSRVGQRLSKAEQDYQAMPPPPPRPILRRPPPTEYSSDSIDAPYREGRTLIRDDSRPRRPSSHRNSVSYDLGDGPERVRVETANNGRRRQSYYGQTASAGSSGYEDKIREAASYQQDVGETVPLTAEILKRQQRRQAGSSRSTKSSASRDESDWRKSATTRTTRSGSGGDGENVTIKVTGTARVMVGGAQIDCPDGGEIEIKQQQQKAIRNGSERSNSEYGGPQRIDDRRSRDEKGSGRSRMSSRHSYNRSKPQQYYGESVNGGWI
jgi:hypothetical protein